MTLLAIILLLTPQLALAIPTPAAITPPNQSPIPTGTSPTWWKPAWHYRCSVNVTTKGNQTAFNLNFTHLLTTLGLTTATLDNNTITVIKNKNNINTITPYTFTEAPTFNPTTNAIGNLTWNANDTVTYLVYFDVTQNTDTRTHTNETTLATGRSVTLSNPEGWRQALNTPIKPAYTPDTPFTIIIFTQATATFMNATITNASYNATLPLIHSAINPCEWTLTTSLPKANYTLTITSHDQAGYDTTPITATLTITKVDLVVNSFSLPTTIYEKTNITIPITIHATNATIPDANISLKINGTLKNNVHTTLTHSTNKTVNLRWYTQQRGKVNITITIHCTNITDTNPANDKLTALITLEGKPDITITNLTVSNTTLYEGATLTTHTTLHNTGNGTAKNYTLGLYLEQRNNTNLTYDDPVDTITYNLTKTAYITLNLTWKADYGKSIYDGTWHLGVYAITDTNTNPDLTPKNNNRSYNHTIDVLAIDHAIPNLTISIKPSIVERSQIATIEANAYDSYGIQSVKATIKKPDGARTTVNMTQLSTTTLYSYPYPDTILTGTYNVTVTATDASSNHNTITKTLTFKVVIDQTGPTINSTSASPSLQIAGNTVDFTCLTWDYSGVKSVTITITDPNANRTTKPMTQNKTDTYHYSQIFTTLGKYTFTVTCKDTYNNTRTSNIATFWITNDLNDTDSDGLPDSWEQLWELDPYNASDAGLDPDQDGKTNLQEYHAGTNPLEAPANATAIEAITDHLPYFACSVLLFTVILVISIILIRRMRP
jgi:hypothetical protein